MACVEQAVVYTLCTTLLQEDALRDLRSSTDAEIQVCHTSLHLGSCWWLNTDHPHNTQAKAQEVASIESKLFRAQEELRQTQVPHPPPATGQALHLTHVTPHQASHDATVEALQAKHDSDMRVSQVSGERCMRVYAAACAHC